MAGQNIYISLVIAVVVLVSARSGTGDFDSQLLQILQEQMLSPQDHVISGALDDVRATLNQRWQDYELIVCGSVTTGLALKTSDVDTIVNIPNFNASASSHVLKQTKKLFQKQPELYRASRYYYDVNVTIFSFFHIPSQRKFEIQFRGGDACISNSQLIRYYFQLDKRFLPLGGFLKYFFVKHGISAHGRGFLPGYGMYMLIIFYLQQKNMAPTGYAIHVNSKSNIVENWDMGFNELPYISTNTESLYQLLGGFFKYYSAFNFEEYIVSPFTGRPIPRSAFKNHENFPQEYTSYNYTLQHSPYNLNTSTDLCIQDVFMHDLNTGELLSHKRATKFKHLIKSVASMFEDLSSESILGAILVTDQHEESVISNNNVTVDEINNINRTAT